MIVRGPRSRAELRCNETGKRRRDEFTAQFGEERPLDGQVGCCARSGLPRPSSNVLKSSMHWRNGYTF